MINDPLVDDVYLLNMVVFHCKALVFARRYFPAYGGIIYCWLYIYMYSIVFSIVFPLNYRHAYISVKSPLLMNADGWLPQIHL